MIPFTFWQYCIPAEIQKFGKIDSNKKDKNLEWYDYGWRMYDPVLGRFHTLDPLTEYFPHQSPFVYANNNPIRYIDYLGLNAEEPEEPIDGGEIEEVVCVGTRPSKNSSSNSSSSSWWTRLINWWNSANPYTETEVDDPMSQDMDWWRDDRIKGNHNVIPRDNKPLYEKVFGWRNKRKKPKIDGDKGAIEATIDDKFKEHLEESNEPAITPQESTSTSNKSKSRANMYDHFNEDSTKIYRIIKGDTIATFKKHNGTYWVE